MIKKDIMTAYQSKHEHENLKKRVMSFKRQLMRFCDILDEPLPEYTGWFVLLKKDGDGCGSFLVFIILIQPKRIQSLSGQ